MPSSPMKTNPLAGKLFWAPLVLNRLFVLLLSICINFLSAQTRPEGYRDQDYVILQAIQKSETDMEKVDLHNQLAGYLYAHNFDEGLIHANEALRLSLSTKYYQGIAEALTLIGNYHFYKGDNKEALSSYRKALAAVAKESKEKLIDFPAKTFLRISVVYRTQSDFDSARMYITKAEQSLAGKRQGLVHAALFGGKGLMAKALAQNDTALFYLKKSLKIRLSYGDSATIADTWRNIGTIHGQMSSHDSADYYFIMAEKTATRTNEQDVLLQLDINRGESDFAKGNYQNAITAYTVALNKLNEYNYVRHYANLLSRMGDAYEAQGYYRTAYEFFYKALIEAEKINDKQQISNIYSQNGWLYNFTENFSMAIENGNRAINMAKQIGDSAAIAQNQNLIGFALYKSKKYESALVYFEQSLAYNKKIKLLWGAAFNLYNMALTYDALGQRAKALDLFLQALEINEKIDKKNGILLVCNSLGLLYIRQGNFQLASKYLSRANQLAKSISHPVELLANYKNFIAMYEAQGNKEKLLGTLKQYVLLDDSMRNNRNADRIAQADILFQLHEKLKEIEQAKEGEERNQSLIQAQQSQIKWRNRVIIGAIVGLVILAVFSVFLFRLLQSNREVNRKLEKQNTEIVEKGEEIAAQAEELEEANQNLQASNAELNEKNEEIGIQSERLRYAALELENLNKGLNDLVMEKTKEIRLSHQKLTESENYLRTIFQSEPECIKILGASGELLDMNPAGLAMIEAETLDQVRGHAVSGLVAPEHRKAFGNLVKDVFSGKSGLLVFEIIGLKGTHRWMESHAVPLRNPEGRIISFLGITRDISGRVVAETQLKESHDRYSNMISNLPGYVYRVANDKDYTPMYISAQVEGITGYHQDEYLIHRTISCGKEIHPEDADSVWAIVQQAIDNNQNYECEYRIITKQGDEKWVSEKGKGIHDETGTLVYLEGFVSDITEKKKSGDALRLAEKNYRNIFENSSDGLWQKTVDGKVLTVNPAGAKMFGYSSVEEAKESIYDIAQQHYANPEDRVKMVEIIRKDGRIIDYEIKGIRKNKEVFWMLLNFQAVYGNDGEIKYFEGPTKDITEQKNAELRLIKEKELSDSIINGMPGAFYLYDSKGKFLRWNKNFEAITGYSGEEIASMHPLQFFDDDEKELLTNKVGEVFTKGFGEVEANLLLKDKSKIPYYLNGWRIEYENKTCLIGVGIDISESKKAEAKAKDSENKLRAFFRSTPDSCVLLGRNFEILALNTAAAELNTTTYGTELHEGDNFLEKIFPEVRPTIKEFVLNAFKGEASQGEFPIPNIRTGHSVWWLGVFLPAYDSDGNVFAVVANSTNIDKLKRSEFKLTKQFEELKKTNHELDRFVYSVSHDLRSPLSSILGLINVAEMENPPPVFGNYFSMIRTSINRLDSFINDILDYSRNSRTDVKLVKIDFQILITEIQHNFRLIKGADRLHTELTINAQSDFYSDNTRIVVLFNNLLSNAIRYQDYKKETSRVRIEIVQSTKEVVIRFSDNGVGIKETHVNKIFDMFYRASEDSAGSGLGLYIVKETLDKLKGSIKVESDFGAFTKFTVTIPNSVPLA